MTQSDEFFYALTPDGNLMRFTRSMIANNNMDDKILIMQDGSQWPYTEEVGPDWPL